MASTPRKHGLLTSLPVAVFVKRRDRISYANDAAARLFGVDKAKQIASGGPIFYDLSGAETFDTILSMVLSPVDVNGATLVRVLSTATSIRSHGMPGPRRSYSR